MRPLPSRHSSSSVPTRASACVLAFVPVLALNAACGGGSDSGTDDKAVGPSTFDGYVVADIVITDSGRTTYFMAVPELSGSFDNSGAVELAGNAEVESVGGYVFGSDTEAPVWYRYSVDTAGEIAPAGEISFAAYGWANIDYYNVFVDEGLALSVNTSLGEGIWWDPSALEILGTLDMRQMLDESFSTELFAPTVVDGRIYLPVRHADWTNYVIAHETRVMVVDTESREIVADIQDPRCPSSGSILLSPDGFAYTMSDGRNYSAQMIARATGAETVPVNCFLRFDPADPGAGFDPDWSVDVPSLTGGREVVTNLATGAPASGVGFAQVMYEEEIDGEPTSFDFWGQPFSKVWRFDLREGSPSATLVDGAPFTGIGFGGHAVDGVLLMGQSTDGATSDVLRFDPDTNTATPLFTIEGFFTKAFKL